MGYSPPTQTCSRWTVCTHPHCTTTTLSDLHACAAVTACAHMHAQLLRQPASAPAAVMAARVPHAPRTVDHTAPPQTAAHAAAPPVPRHQRLVGRPEQALGWLLHNGGVRALGGSTRCVRCFRRRSHQCRRLHAPTYRRHQCRRQHSCTATHRCCCPHRQRQRRCRSHEAACRCY